ncbi:hypothetical protein GLOIN_2v1665395 [Rhizophagus clarus]|uniref:Uncharacterized protein n=1 Tax=Rhizophagus clarus TaxID=94130 RepID=A0A8H3QYN0_9GLOM|nr:hypothetical protein GLOIN_2v1665395 [Rhizophagus clarus]
MLNKCCFCIDLKSGTLVSAFISFNHKYESGIFFIASIIILIGFIGVLKDDEKTFFLDPKITCKRMIENHETDMDLETCISFLNSLEISVYLFFILVFLIELYFYCVICSYHLKLIKDDIERLLNDFRPPSYGSNQIPA